MSLSKKIFLFSSSLLAIVLIFWGIYSLAFKKTEPPETTLSSTAPIAATPLEIKKDPSKISLVSEDAVLSPAINQAGNLIRYYSKDDGKIYQMRLDGSSKQALSAKEFPMVSSVIWSADDSQAILKILLDGKPRFVLYNFLDGKETVIKDNVDTMAWQNNAKIAYKYYESKNNKRTINISDPDGSNWSPIADTAFRNVAIAPIPKTALVSFWNEPDSFTETNMQSASILGTDAKSIFSGKFGADYLWSPEGDKILISHSSEKSGGQMQLALSNSKGGEYKNLVAPTFVSKCAWSRDDTTIYCALPGAIPDFAILPNDYNESKFKTADTFWKINTSTGEKVRLVELEQMSGSFDAFGLFLNLDESTLFFTNKQDRKIYRIEL